MDNDCNYSNDGLLNKAAFFDKTYTVYVEGPEDVHFWDSLFLKEGITDFHIEDVGGKENLPEYIDKIVSEDLKIIVACDADYSSINNNYEKHDRIIYTYGYSIENTMYRTRRINEIIQYLSKRRIDLTADIVVWKNKFEEQCSELLVYDYANHKFDKGIKVLGLNCCYLLVNNNSKNFSDAKINKHINNIKNSFSQSEIATASLEIDRCKKSKWDLIKGHFLTNAVFNLIKSSAEKISLTKIYFTIDSLYALCVDCAKYHEDYDIKPILLEIKKAEHSIRNSA